MHSCALAVALPPNYKQNLRAGGIRKSLLLPTPPFLNKSQSPKESNSFVLASTHGGTAVRTTQRNPARIKPGEGIWQMVTSWSTRSDRRSGEVSRPAGGIWCGSPRLRNRARGGEERSPTAVGRAGAIVGWGEEGDRAEELAEGGKVAYL
jgi:hypothetical protein